MESAGEIKPGRLEPRGLQGWRGPALWLAAVGSFGLLLFLYHYLAVLAERGDETPWKPFLNEFTGALVAGLLFFPLRAAVRRWPLTAASWRRRLPLYLLAVLPCGAAATTLMWGLRSALYPLAGLGAYDYGVMPLRYLMELPLQVVWLALLTAALHAWNALAAARARELRAAHLEASLARAQVRNLRLQLQPHFLFNALNTISATMYGDPRAADEMLEQLAELLRASLSTAQADEVPLAEELALLDRYLALLAARFGDRLAVTLDVAPETLAVLVPSMLLQPLVENAVRHGGAERSGHGAVTVRARQEDRRLVLEVEDDGPGAGEPGDVGGTGGTGGAGKIGGTAGLGLGVAGTAERLQLLYGTGHTFAAGPGRHGGFLVRAALPWHPAGSEVPG